MKPMPTSVHRLETLTREVVGVAADLSSEIDGLPIHNVQLDRQLRHLAFSMFKTSGAMLVILFKHGLKANPIDGNELEL